MTDHSTQPAQTILIVDDHDLVRDLIARHLSVAGGFAVTSANSLADAALVVRTSGPFDLVLLDLSLPGVKGLEGLDEMLDAKPDSKVVIFSGVASRGAVAQALAKGAVGYIPKDLPLKSLVNAVNFVLAGEVYLPASYVSDQRPETRQPASGLSPREMIVLRGIRAGQMNKQIAHDMGLSEVTVKMHVRSICKKLGAKNRTQAAMLASGMVIE